MIHQNYIKGSNSQIFQSITLLKTYNMFFLYILGLALIFIISFVYLSDNRSERHWAKYGVPYYRGFMNLGFAWEYFIGRLSFFEVLHRIYKKYPNVPVIATKSFLNPTLIITDAENIQHVLAGDFQTFSHRGIELNGDVDLLSDSIIFMNGARWKLTRQKFTPLFTSAKLRNMYYIMNKGSQDFVDLLKREYKNEGTHDLLSTFCSAAISASVFGITTKSIMDSPFLDMARKNAKPTFTFNLKFTIANFSNKLFNILKIKLFSEFEEFFIGAMKKVLQERRRDKVRTHDFADLCIDVQKNGIMKDKDTGLQIEPTDELMSAQAFFFFNAGIDPSANSMFFMLFELCRNPDIRERLHEEIDELFERTKGEISHEDVLGLDYLDRVLDESMRMHSPIGALTRMCTKDATLPVGNIDVPKNMLIQIPTFSIHYEPRYYPNPQKFDPDRFTEEEKSKRPSYTFMPFGEGNRMCLGIRFAKLQIKTGLVHLLRHFTVESDDTHKRVEYLKAPFLCKPKNIDFRFVPRQPIN